MKKLLNSICFSIYTSAPFGHDARWFQLFYQMNRKKKNLIHGFGIIEIILAVSLFLIIATTAVVSVVHSFSVNRMSHELSFAHTYSQEGIEAARSIRNMTWSNLMSGTFAIDLSTGVWRFTPGSNTNGKFNRTITVYPVMRDGTQNIVTGGGSVDPDTFRIESKVSWNFSPTRTNDVLLATYLTNFRKPIITIEGRLNMSKNNNARKVQTSGDYAFVIRSGGVPDLSVVNIANPTNPTEVVTLTLPGDPTNLYIMGNYAYIGSTANNQELTVVNITNPTSPSIIGTFNADRNNDVTGVYGVGDLIYLSRLGGVGEELVIVNVANPANPTRVGGLHSADNVFDLVVVGNYAYLATKINSQELQVVNITNPSTPTISATLDLTGTDNGRSIDGSGDTLVLGRENGEVATINISNPNLPYVVSTYSSVGTPQIINDIYFHAANSLVYLASDNSLAEFQVINLVDLSSPQNAGSLDLPDILSGVTYHPNTDRVVAVGNTNNEELIIIKLQ